VAACGPFTDVAADAFCPFVLEIFTLGITTGTTTTTYDPTGNVTRLQMAAFLSRTVDSAVRRGSARAAAERFWAPQNETGLGITTLGNGNPGSLACDGADVWAANLVKDTISRIRGSDGRLLETWTGATFAAGILAALDGVVATGSTSPGRLYRIVASQPAGAVTTVASNLGDRPAGIAFDGARFWVACSGNTTGSVSIVSPGPSVPWTVTTVTAGFTVPVGALYDGTNVWVTDGSANTLLKLDASGAILQTVTVGLGPDIPVFDGENIWVPNNLVNSVSVVRASTGAVLATLTGNGLNRPGGGAFDGQRVLIANGDATTSVVSVWKAADLTPRGSFTTGFFTSPSAACSDGLNVFVALLTGEIARF
jgi:hypothetical protein